jgi:hypothetical protein
MEMRCADLKRKAERDKTEVLRDRRTLVAAYIDG